MSTSPRTVPLISIAVAATVFAHAGLVVAMSVLSFSRDPYIAQCARQVLGLLLANAPKLTS